MNNIQYEALAVSIKVEDITTNDNNRNTLRHIQRNESHVLEPDPSEGIYTPIDLNSLTICDLVEDNYEETCYTPEKGVHDMGWLGYFVGKNVHLKVLHIFEFTPPSGASVTEVLDAFIMGVSRNKSITRLDIREVDLSGSNIFNTLGGTFFKNNYNLVCLNIDDCNVGVEGSRALSLALSSCENSSLNEVSLRSNRIEDDGLVDIITALNMHPNLESLVLDGNNLRRNGCTALSTLLQLSCTKLSTLSIDHVELDDEGMDALVPALKKCNHLETLYVERNYSITTRGWQNLATILEVPNSKLELFCIKGNDIDHQAGTAFANALVNNDSCRLLLFRYDSTILHTMELQAFSKLLCDTSSIEATYLSNHTLKRISTERYPCGAPLGLEQLTINRSQSYDNDKRIIAKVKILMHHNDFDMMPFFEWEFKVLPLMINWFERASTIRIPRSVPMALTDEGVEPNIGPRKLSCIYQFVRGMPDLYVETRLRQELEEIKLVRLQMEERERDILERLGRK